MSTPQAKTPSGRNRDLIAQFDGIPASDGDGVRLTRVIGSPQINMLDPFLLLDVFETDQPSDYIGGFPPHPHRGFETVTYMLAGCMRHKDNAGHEGVITPGAVQWMRAGRGIVHSEMPEQEQGLMKGFQLWVNLPARGKMSDPDYQEFPAEMIAVESREGVELKVIAGTTDAGTTGPVVQEFTEPIFLDISVDAGVSFQQTVPATHNAFVYVIDGQIAIGEQGKVLGARQLGVLSKGDLVSITGHTNARVLLMAGRQLNEPVARGGPFVMNTKAEVLQAFKDYEEGRF